ncbi:MAG: hypothetical protein AB7U82_27850 [Blastocatellales bacterium]
MPNYDELSLDQLRDAKVAIDAKIEVLREEKRAIARIEDRELAEAEAHRIVANLSDDQKRALAQSLKPVGIEEPAETVSE